jgi:hypothetical protein
MIKTNIHSMVDIITNSSTTIYTTTHGGTIFLLKELINEILEVAGSDKTADDLYEFKQESNEDDYYDCYGEKLIPDEVMLIPKDTSKKTIDLRDRIKSMLNIDGWYNG